MTEWRDAMKNLERLSGIRLIATDLDGTLLDPNGKLTDYTLETLHACEERGIKVVMSSGRTFENVRLLARQAGLSSPIISCNGGRIDASPFGPVIMEDVIPMPDARIVFDLLKASGLFIECYTGNTIYRLHPELSPFLPSPEAYRPTPVIPDEDGFEQRFVDDEPERMLEEGVPRAYKLAAFSRDPARLAALRRELEPMNLFFSSAFPYNLEIMGKGHGKGRCIRFLADWLGLNLDQVIAFGDNTNDREMLMAAGFGCAMGNGVPALKEIADLVAPTNAENGEAQIIRKYILQTD